VLADHRTVVVVFLDKDAVHQRRTVDGGPAVRLGHQQQARLAQELLGVGR
jgi:hypothetical protein